MTNVYAIIADCDPKMVKFGIAKDPQKRLLTLQTGSPVQLELACFVGGPRSLEGMIHRALRHLRRHGEWFSLEYEAIEMVELIDAGNERAIFSRSLEILDELHRSTLDITPDPPDKDYWGDRGE